MIAINTNTMRSYLDTMFNTIIESLQLKVFFITTLTVNCSITATKA